MKKKNIRTFKILISVILVFSFFLAFWGNFIYSFALLRQSVFSRDSITALLSGKKEDTAVYSGTDEVKKTWLELHSQGIYMNGDSGMSLHGLFVKKENDSHRYAIVCHGYSSKAVHMSYFAKMLYDRGFSVLAPDARAHGESDGNVRGMGYLERRDIISWIHHIEQTDPLAEFLLYGFSMGGATVLFTSGESDLPSSVKAVISDCAYTDVYSEIANTVKTYAPIPSFPVVDAASVVCKIRGGYSFKEASVVEAVKKSTTPTLFIHGSADTFVPFSMLDELYSSASCEKDILVIEGATHARSATHNPEVYWGKVEEFVERYF